MATLQDQNNQSQPGAAGTQPISGTSAPASGQGAAGTSQAPISNVQQNAAPQASQGYTDVSAYLNANQQGGQQLGQQVASNLTNAYNSTIGNINTSAGNATSQINQGYTPENTSLIQQVENNPTSVASNPSQTSAFQQQLNDQYTGPSNWADLGNLQGQVTQAQQSANLNVPGSANVMAQNVEQQLNPGQTSAGINALDTLLLTGNPGAVNAVQTAAQPFNTLNDYLNTQNVNIGNQIQGAQNTAAQTAADALAAGTGAINNINTAVTGTRASDLAAAQAQQAQIKQDIANLYGGQALNTAPTTLGTYGGGTTPWVNSTNYTVGQLSPQDIASLGMTPDQWNQLQSSLQAAGTSQLESGHNFAAPSGTTQIDLSQYLNQLNPATAITNQTVATPDQVQQMSALNQLLGSKAPTQTEVINPALASLAGTYNPNALNQFNYNAALQNAQGTSAQEIAQAQQEAAALTGQADLAHAQSQQHGGFLSSLNPVNIIGTAINPASWIPNAINAAQNKPISGTNIIPNIPGITG